MDSKFISDEMKLNWKWYKFLQNFWVNFSSVKIPSPNWNPIIKLFYVEIDIIISRLILPHYDSLVRPGPPFSFLSSSICSVYLSSLTKKHFVICCTLEGKNWKKNMEGLKIEK